MAAVISPVWPKFMCSVTSFYIQIWCVCLCLSVFCYTVFRKKGRKRKKKMVKRWDYVQKSLKIFTVGAYSGISISVVRNRERTKNCGIMICETCDKSNVGKRAKITNWKCKRFSSFASLYVIRFPLCLFDAKCGQEWKLPSRQNYVHLTPTQAKR